MEFLIWSYDDREDKMLSSKVGSQERKRENQITPQNVVEMKSLLFFFFYRLLRFNPRRELQTRCIDLTHRFTMLEKKETSSRGTCFKISFYG